jgi:hypothetical protein
MHRFAVLGFACALTVAGFANAATYVVGPNDLAQSKAQFAGPAPDSGGTNPFAFDFDSAAPDYLPGAPAGFGFNSMGASVTNNAAGADANAYRTFRVSPEALKGSALTVAGLQDFSYQNFQLGGASTFHVTIYTLPTGPGTGDQASWYHNRIQAFPTPGALNTWETLDTSPGGMQFSMNGNFTPIGNWDLIQSLVGNDRIMWMDFGLGTKHDGGTESAQLDAINFNFGTAAPGATINLEAVPLPSAAGMGLGLVSLMGLARRRKA